MTQPSPLVADPLRLLALAEADDAAAVTARDRAWRMTFDTPEGQLVLLDILRLGHVGELCGVQDIDQIRFRNGEHDLALKIAQSAGYTPEALMLRVLTGTLERNHVRSEHRPVEDEPEF